MMMMKDVKDERKLLSVKKVIMTIYRTGSIQDHNGSWFPHSLLIAGM
jgi:hypothetical protein